MKEKNKILKKLKELSDPDAVAGMAKYGINSVNTYGVSIPKLRRLAKDIGKNPELACDLWDSAVHEARILASMIHDPELLSEEEMEKWVKDFDSWDVCDQTCMNLFEDSSLAFNKAIQWSKRRDEFVKRAGFVMMARLAVSDKKASDDKFIKFFEFIKNEADDGRNYVKKAVNWALRQIGKRNLNLNRLAIKISNEIKEINSKSAGWIASDALRELKSQAIQNRLKNRLKN